MILKINSTTLVRQFLDRYQIWCDHKSFYDSHHDPLAKNSEDGIPCYMYVDIHSINQHKNQLIAIDCLTEGIHSLEFFKQYNNTNHYLIFSNGVWDPAHYEIGIDYTLIHHKFFLTELADTYNSPNRFCFYLDKTYDFGTNKPYVFVSLIGEMRELRTHLVDGLMSRLKYKNFLLRYSGKDVNGNGSDDVIGNVVGRFDAYTPILQKYYHNVSQTMPIKLFNQGFFNLVVESDIDWSYNFFLTEKTVKALITGMPFVIVSDQYFLKNLRELGFKTYSSLWDESYDEIEDPIDRIDEIIKLCNHLHDFDWTNHKEELSKIAFENRSNFLNLNKVVDYEFSKFETILKNLTYFKNEI
jgi:hypothetical protein